MIFRKKTALKYISEKSILTGSDLELFSNILWKEKEVVLAAVKKNEDALKYASPRLKDDKDIVLEAIKSSSVVSALRYASPRLKDDKDVVLEAVEHDGEALEFASPRLQDDKDIVLEAVKERKYALQYASPRLKDDKDVVLKAVKHDGDALQYASPRLQKEKEFFDWMCDIDRSPEMFEYLPLDYFRSNEQITPFIEIIKNSLKDRVGQDVSQEDQEYATGVIKMVKDTIAEKRKEIDKIEQEKIKIEQEKNEKAQCVKDYKDKIDKELGQI